MEVLGSKSSEYFLRFLCYQSVDLGSQISITKVLTDFQKKNNAPGHIAGIFVFGLDFSIQNTIIMIASKKKNTGQLGVLDIIHL